MSTRSPKRPARTPTRGAAGFAARHGRLAQVELEALDPNVLRGLYDDALAHYWDVSAYDAVLADEASDRARLARLVP